LIWNTVEKAKSVGSGERFQLIGGVTVEIGKREEVITSQPQIQQWPNDAREQCSQSHDVFEASSVGGSKDEQAAIAQQRYGVLQEHVRIGKLVESVPDDDRIE
jgi:hypothetical protein